jgi:polyhydroxybutyrate depolymerase
MLLSRRNRPTLILIALLAVLFALLCTVCVPMRVFAAESAERTFAFGGLERSYRFYRPASAPRSQAVALVVVLHGATGSAEQAERAYGWNDRADAAGFTVAYPDGIGRTWNWAFFAEHRAPHADRLRARSAL